MNDADLKRIYADTAGDEPPPALDAAVLAYARAAVRDAANEADGQHAGAPPRVRSWLPCWQPRLALAAVLVMSVSLVLVAEREQPEVAGVAPPVRNHALEPMPTTNDAAPRAAPVNQNRSAGAATARADGREAAHDARRSAASETAGGASSGGSGDANLGQREAAPANAVRDGIQVAPQVDEPAESSGAARKSGNEMRKPEAASGAAANSSAIDAATPSARKSDRSLAVPFPAQPVPVPAPAIPPLVLPAPAPLALQVPPAAAASPVPPASAPPASSLGGKVAMPQRQLSTETNVVTPEGRLIRLAELKKEGKAKEFADGLAEFKKRYPNYPVPEALLRP